MLSKGFRFVDMRLSERMKCNALITLEEPSVRDCSFPGQGLLQNLGRSRFYGQRVSGKATIKAN